MTATGGSNILSRWPSIIWQFFWSWIVAPTILWRARRIHDTLGWRTQTLACCLAGYVLHPAEQLPSIGVTMG